MDEILKNLLSPAWLFSTIFVGLLINIVANYTTKYFDSWSAKTSKEKRMRLQTQRLLDMERLQAAVTNSDERLAEYIGMLLSYLKYMIFLIQGVSFSIMSIIFSVSSLGASSVMIITRVVLVGIALIISFMSYNKAAKHLDQARDTEAMLEQVRKFYSSEEKKAS